MCSTALADLAPRPVPAGEAPGGGAEPRSRRRHAHAQLRTAGSALYRSFADHAFRHDDRHSASNPARIQHDTATCRLSRGQWRLKRHRDKSPFHAGPTCTSLYAAQHGHAPTHPPMTRLSRPSSIIQPVPLRSCLCGRTRHAHLSLSSPTSQAFRTPLRHHQPRPHLVSRASTTARGWPHIRRPRRRRPAPRWRWARRSPSRSPWRGRPRASG